MIARMIDELLEGAQEQYHTFQEVQDRPYVLSDAIVQKTIQVYTAQMEDLWIYEEQLARKKREPVSTTGEGNRAAG